MTPLATIVEDDATLAYDELMILDRSGAVTWRGYLDAPSLGERLREAARVRMHPRQVCRQAALAADRGAVPIALR